MNPIIENQPIINLAFLPDIDIPSKQKIVDIQEQDRSVHRPYLFIVFVIVDSFLFIFIVEGKEKSYNAQDP